MHSQGSIPTWVKAFIAANAVLALVLVGAEALVLRKYKKEQA